MGDESGKDAEEEEQQGPREGTSVRDTLGERGKESLYLSKAIIMRIETASELLMLLEGTIHTRDNFESFVEGCVDLIVTIGDRLKPIGQDRDLGVYLDDKSMKITNELMELIAKIFGLRVCHGHKIRVGHHHLQEQRIVKKLQKFCRLCHKDSVTNSPGRQADAEDQR